jgi:hypothetical protein
MTRRLLGAALAALLLAGLAPALGAQLQHDVTGPPTAGSDIAGGAFSPDTLRLLETPEVAVALSHAAARVAAGANAGTLTDVAGAPLPYGVQVTALAALQGFEADLAEVLAAIALPGWTGWAPPSPG